MFPINLFTVRQKGEGGSEQWEKETYFYRYIVKILNKGCGSSVKK